MPELLLKGFMFIVDLDVVKDVISACRFRTFPAPVLNVDMPSADE